ncbi:MAG: tryptophan 7-halogenase [Prochlorotrichaceae cyanobacterium]
MRSPIQKVVILGASSAGLLTAVALKHYFPSLHVSLLYSQKHAPIGVGESTTAWFPQFLHDHLQIPHQEFYQAVSPIWKLGIRFEWGQPSQTHFNYTFDRQLAYDPPDLTRSTGYYCMYDMQQASEFSILMDKQHAPIWVDSNGKLRAVTEGFGYHLGIDELLNFLSEKSTQLKIDSQVLEVLDAHRDEQGNIEYLICENGVKIAADLFIDCSGFQSKLLGGILQEPFISYNHRLFCDTAVTGHWQRESPILPFTTVTTMNSGWRWRIDLHDRVSFGYVYSSQFCTVEQAIQELLAVTPLDPADLKTIHFRSGRYQNFWVNNVIAIGNAGGFVEPLESTGQHMIAETILQVMLALQDSHLCPHPKLIQTVNTYIGRLWDEICNFLALHFKFNQMRQTPFWQHCQQETTLGEAQDIVEMYQMVGVCRALSHLMPPSSIFEVDGYLTLLCGQQLAVQNLADITSSELREWSDYRQRLRQKLQGSLPTHQALKIRG